MKIIYRGIQQTKNTCGGRARIKGRRVDVQLILMQLRNGTPIEQIAEGYQLSKDEVQTAVGYALKCVRFFDDQKKE